VRGFVGYFDPAPLLLVVARRLREAGSAVNDVQMARLLGVHTAQVLRWRHGTHRIRVDVADRCAVRCGLHPGEVWPEWFGPANEAAA